MVKIAFRLNANAVCGTKHLNRCLAIASAFAETNPESSIFFLTSSSDEYQEIIHSSRFSFVSLGPAVSSYEDSEVTTTAIEEREIDILIVDLPNLSESYLKSIKPKVKLLSVIDEKCSLSNYPVDILINPSIYAHTLDYNIPSSAQLLLGTEFFPLPKIFDDFIDQKYEVSDSVKKILVYLQSQDNRSALLNIISGLRQIKDIFTANIILDKNFSKGAELAALIGLDDRFVIITDSIDVKKKIALTDLAIISPCEIFYEFAFFKVPCISVLVSDSDLIMSNHLSQYSFTAQSNYSPNEIQRNVSTLISNKDIRRRMSMRLEELVDGLGRFRVADELLKAYNEKVK
ncbi:MAG: hypothetical protein ACP5N9_02225 [Candidatus Bilamarchaeum sp.]|jgi:spore coat polysaccharide biosynthesis predicted glycosyltransferase SpsG